MPLEVNDGTSLLSNDNKKSKYQEFIRRTEQIPYSKAIENLTDIQDLNMIRSPFEMVTAIANISKDIEEAITEFWSGINIIEPDKLIIDGDNILMLYLYILLRARVPKMFGYIKVMDEFSTSYVRSISRYGYCLSTLEIAMERLTTMSLKDLVEQQNTFNIADRSMVFMKNMRESFMMARERAGSLYVDIEEH